MIVMAMAAIGLNTDLKKLIKNGVKPIFLGICCWTAVAVASLLVQRIIGIW
ncbi:MAG: putative sulfate exporter family transporter, partial [Acidaminococcaceae bacterium]